MCAGYLVGCGWWGGRRVGGVLVSGCGFWLGSGFCGGVSGGWPCLFGGSGRLAGGWCDVRGSVPLRPLLNSRPHLLGGLWFLVRVVPLLGGAGCWLVGVFGLQFFSDGVGWSGGWLVLRVVSWLGCSQPGVVVAVLVGCSGLVVCLSGFFPGWGLRGLCPVSGGCSQACCVVPVGWADLDGRALPRPPLSPPTIHDDPPQPLKSGGQTHTLKR